MQLNAPVQRMFTVVDLSGADAPGLTSAAFNISLRMRVGSALIAASETVTVQSIGGRDYWIFFTPTVLATFYVLTISPVSANYIVSAPAEGYQFDIEADVLAVAGPYLTTRDRMKAAFGFKGNDEDAMIDALLPQITEYFQSYCGRSFFQETITEYPAPPSSRFRTLFVGRPPVASVTSLHISATLPRVYDATTVLVEGMDFVVDASGQWIELVSARSVCGPTARVAKLVYVGGYETVPGDIERAAQEVISVKVQKSKQQGQYHYAGINSGDGTMQGIRFDDLTPNAQAVLESYRLRAIA